MKFNLFFYFWITLSKSKLHKNNKTCFLTKFLFDKERILHSKPNGIKKIKTYHIKWKLKQVLFFSFFVLDTIFCQKKTQSGNVVIEKYNTKNFINTIILNCFPLTYFQSIFIIIKYFFIYYFF